MEYRLRWKSREKLLRAKIIVNIVNCMQHSGSFFYLIKD